MLWEGPLMTQFRFNLAASAILIVLFSTSFSSALGALVQPGTQTAPDNSAQNKDQGLTADNQANAKADRLTTANIRKAIIADKDLSTYAHNVKIITVNGAVTLKGPVKSEEEKEKVASDAAGVVPADKITNHLTVKQ
jgi:hyperosmotically inducible protein